MNLRRTLIFSLPLLLSSSLAMAQQQPATSTDDTHEHAQQQQQQHTKKKTTDAKQPEQKKQKEGQGTGNETKSTTILGKKVENKDKDLDVSVGQTKTTSAEQPPPRDVIESRAEEVHEVQGKRWSAAPLLGYGTADLKFGVGARAGYTFDSRVYVGGTFLYHFGNSNVETTGLGVTDTNRTFYYPAGEAGYDIGVGPVLVRPYGGVGVIFAHTSVTTNGIEASATDKQLMIFPGITAQYIFPRSPVFVGADTRVLIPLEGESASFNVFATAGVSM